jgi:hypothetical protein
VSDNDVGVNPYLRSNVKKGNHQLFNRTLLHHNIIPN